MHEISRRLKKYIKTRTNKDYAFKMIFVPSFFQFLFAQISFSEDCRNFNGTKRHYLNDFDFVVLFFVFLYFTKTVKIFFQYKASPFLTERTFRFVELRFRFF